MKIPSRTLIAAALATASASAVADGISANVALATDYRFRGVSQTDNQMALQGGFDWSHESGFYAGTWASNVDSQFFSGSDHDPQLEWDLYLGFSGEMDAFSYDVGILRYIYPGYDDANTTEIYFGGSYSVSDDASIGATLYYSPELKFVGSADSAWYLSLSGEMGVAEGVTIHVGAGYSFGDAFDGADSNPDADYNNYWDYSIGVSGSVAGVDLDLSWIGTDSDGSATTLGFGGVADDTVVLTISKSF